MSAALQEVRELLREFAQSEWRDLYVRTDSYSLFIAKAHGAPNPMLAPTQFGSMAPEPLAIEPLPLHAITAPHVGTVVSVLEPGQPVEPGTVVGRIQVLDAVFEIQSDRRGIVDAVLAPVATLVEYETPLLRLR